MRTAVKKERHQRKTTKPRKVPGNQGVGADNSRETQDSRVLSCGAPDGAGAAKQGRITRWRDVPHSPLPFRDGGCNVFVGADGHVVGILEPLPVDCRDEASAMRNSGNYRYMLCAVNCHEPLVAAAKRLLVLLEGRGEDTRELRALVARAEEHFE